MNRPMIWMVRSAREETAKVVEWEHAPPRSTAEVRVSFTFVQPFVGKRRKVTNIVQGQSAHRFLRQSVRSKE